MAATMLALPFTPLAAQRPAPEQRGGAPGANTPQLVVGVLASKDPALGVGAADAIRRRIQNEHSAKDLYVVPAPKIEQTLRSSGYNPDSVLAPTDLVALAKQVRGDYALAGTVERTTAGMEASLRLLVPTGSKTVAEPLTAIAGPDFGAIAKQVDRVVSEAIRTLAYYHECTSAAAVGEYAKAMAAAQQGLRIRPTSASLNSCVLSVLAATRAAPDSIIAVATVITAADSTSDAAWAHLADAYLRKGEAARALDATLVLHRLEPANATVTLGLVDQLVGAAKADVALAVLDTAVRAAPTNAELLRKRWLLDLRLGRAREALSSGASLIAADSSAATADFYKRQLVVIQGSPDSASMREVAHQVALEASARFPQNVDFLLVLARDAVDRGAAQEALSLSNRVLSIEPANRAAWQLAISAHARADADSAVATARRALAAGVPADAVGGSLLAVVAPVLAAAQSSHSRADWEKVLRTAQAVDSVASSPRSAYYIGAAAFQIATDEIQSLVELTKRPSLTRAERQSACGDATQIEDLVRMVTIAMPRGGSVDPATAGKVLSALPGYSEFVSSVKRTTCR